MISDRHTADLLAIAGRVARMPLACHRDPEVPHLARSALAAELEALVYDLRRDVPPATRGAIAPGAVVVGGRTIPVVGPSGRRRRP